MVGGTTYTDLRAATCVVSSAIYRTDQDAEHGKIIACYTGEWHLVCSLMGNLGASGPEGCVASSHCTHTDPPTQHQHTSGAGGNDLLGGKEQLFDQKLATLGNKALLVNYVSTQRVQGGSFPKP